MAAAKVRMVRRQAAVAGLAEAHAGAIAASSVGDQRCDGSGGCVVLLLIDGVVAGKGAFLVVASWVLCRRL
jgi:hypothetical protein